MKNKQTYFLLYLVLITLNIKAQLININPDPNGPVWALGGVRAPVPTSYWDLIEFIPNQASYSLGWPSAIDNSELPYFPYIKMQDGQSCVQMSEVWYIFTYEMNRKFNRTAANWSIKVTVYNNNFQKQAGKA